MSDFLWKIGGEAGAGIMTTGLSFAKIASRLGYHVIDFVEYPSLIRGGHNSYEVRVADEKVGALKKEVDCLVCLNEDTFRRHRQRLTPSSYVIYDEADFAVQGEFIKIAVPFKKILSESKGSPVMMNMLALGASLAVIGADLDIVNDIIQEQFADKDQTIVDLNQKFAGLGFNYVKTNYQTLVKTLLPKKNEEKKMVLTGNDAFSLASVVADCRLFAAYPMTPASSVLTTLAAWQEKTGMIVRHSEDEIAVINTALGSSFAGVRSAIATSGGGFALMVEALSFAGVAEIPLVVFLAQRPGPATGMPTWTEQGDLLFAVNAGHGEFPKIVLAPGDVAEMIELTAKAFDLADVYQLPVIILSDMYLSESHQTYPIKGFNDFTASYRVNRGKLVNQPSESKYLRYKVTDDGISERLVPGTSGYFYQANSYEHLEDGHSTEDAAERVKQVEKRERKRITYLKQDFQPAKIYGDMAAATVVFVSWGSTKGPIIEAQKILDRKRVKSAFIHFTHLYPLEKDKIRPLFSQGKRYVLVENNYSGQFGKLLRAEAGIELNDQILKYNGRNFYPEEISEKLFK